MQWFEPMKDARGLFNLQALPPATVQSIVVGTDSRTVFTGESGAILQHDLLTGKEYRFGATVLREQTFLSRGIFGELFSLKALPLPVSLTGVKFGYAVDHLSLSPDGKLLLATTLLSLRVWEVETAKELLHHDWPNEAFPVSHDAAFDARGKLVAWAGTKEKGDADRSWSNVFVWGLPGGNDVRTLVGGTGEFRHVCLSTDGRYLLTSGSDYGKVRGELPKGAKGRPTLQAFDLSVTAEVHGADRGPIRTFEPFVGNFSKPQLTSDNKFVICGDGKLVGIWDFQAGHKVAGYAGHKADVTCVGCLPDGKRFLSADAAGTILLWSLDNPEPLCRADDSYKRGITALVMMDKVQGFAAVSRGMVNYWVVPD